MPTALTRITRPSMHCRRSTNIVPLSAYGKPYNYKAPPVNPNPGFSMTDSPQKVINAMDTSTYFNMMAKLMGGAAPPAPEDAPMVARMAKIGIVPGQPFDMSKLDPAVQAALKDLPRPLCSASKTIRICSVTLYFQNESPGKDKEANWLPAPKGDFIAMLRMYWPKELSPSILNGSWKPPAVTLRN